METEPRNEKGNGEELPDFAAAEEIRKAVASMADIVLPAGCYLTLIVRVDRRAILRGFGVPIERFITKDGLHALDSVPLGERMEVTHHRCATEEERRAPSSGGVILPAEQP